MRCISFWYFQGHSGPLSLAIPPWVGAKSTGDGFGQCRRKKRRTVVEVHPRVGLIRVRVRVMVRVRVRVMVRVS